MQTRFEFELPGWVGGFVASYSAGFATVEERMGLAIALSAENVARKTGGPFGAAVFDEGGGLVSVGVNLVPSAGSSILHAEVVAIALAQRAVGRYDLSDGGRESYELVASCEPCAMCYGAVPWSGVKRLVCGARKEDAEAVGFDEGAKPEDWVAALEGRGVGVAQDIARSSAVDVLNAYGTQQGKVY